VSAPGTGAEGPVVAVGGGGVVPEVGWPARDGPVAAGVAVVGVPAAAGGAAGPAVVGVLAPAPAEAGGAAGAAVVGVLAPAPAEPGGAAGAAVVGVLAPAVGSV
jgi:hypothetical protein